MPGGTNSAEPEASVTRFVELLLLVRRVTPEAVETMADDVETTPEGVEFREPEDTGQLT